MSSGQPETGTQPGIPQQPFQQEKKSIHSLELTGLALTGVMATLNLEVNHVERVTKGTANTVYTDLVEGDKILAQEPVTVGSGEDQIQFTTSRLGVATLNYVSRLLSNTPAETNEMADRIILGAQASPQLQEALHTLATLGWRELAREELEQTAEQVRESINTPLHFAHRRLGAFSTSDTADSIRKKFEGLGHTDHRSMLLQKVTPLLGIGPESVLRIWEVLQGSSEAIFETLENRFAGVVNTQFEAGQLFATILDLATREGHDTNLDGGYQKDTNKMYQLIYAVAAKYFLQHLKDGILSVEGNRHITPDTYRELVDAAKVASALDANQDPTYSLINHPAEDSSSRRTN